ncbi:hypothetical protein R3P38DRAFT_1677801 [Favolaschia claudopus]|uniref:Secreted protein n=1 Tax=Favolaschia claudopus TaxID=2862362 RepID=A0AAW0ADC4_9AGAR
MLAALWLRSFVSDTLAASKSGKSGKNLYRSPQSHFEIVQNIGLFQGHYRTKARESDVLTSFSSLTSSCSSGDAFRRIQAQSAGQLGLICCQVPPMRSNESRRRSGPAARSLS